MFVEGAVEVVELSANYDHTCGLSENGSISCWGRNKYGGLGIGQGGDRNAPHQVDYNSGPFASIIGPAPPNTWESESGLRGRVIDAENDVWDVSMTAPESAELFTYDLHITLLKIGGIREEIIVEDVIEIIEKDTDGDGVVDSLDAFPTDSSETNDADGDGVGDNADFYPSDSTRSEESNAVLSTNTYIIGAVVLLVVLTALMLSRKKTYKDEDAPKPSRFRFPGGPKQKF
tara:strand:- start:834 stop:1526 length:693 start_codon:yes stop_codon:yes gene_type:complete